jgi:hypothetical protein
MGIAPEGGRVIERIDAEGSTILPRRGQIAPEGGGSLDCCLSTGPARCLAAAISIADLPPSGAIADPEGSGSSIEDFIPISDG